MRRSIVPCLEVGLWTSSTSHLHGLPFKTLLLCVKHILYMIYPISRGALSGCNLMNACICASLLLVKWVALGCARGATCTLVHLLGDVGSVVGRERKPSQFREGALRRNTSWVARNTLHLPPPIFSIDLQCCMPLQNLKLFTGTGLSINWGLDTSSKDDFRGEQQLGEETQNSS